MSTPAKKVLVMCTGNSCRSIIGEALINARLEGVEAYSCGVAPSGAVNPNARRVLEVHGIWDERYHSKELESVIDVPFDMVVTVCDHARETCPVFPYSVPIIHIGFEDPDGKPYEAFVQIYNDIATVLLPEISRNLGIIK
jgi:arsenate reductase